MMVSRNFYVWVIIVAALGFVASLFILPREQELAMMNYQDKRFERSFEIYKDQWNQGERGVSVALPLARLHLHFGDIEQSIAVMENFIQTHPGNLEAHRYVGQLYIYGHQKANYLRNAEKIHQLQPTNERISELIELHHDDENYDHVIHLLHQKITHYPPEAEDIGRLAYLYATDNRYADATQTLEKLHRLKMTPDDFPTLILATSIWLDAGEPDIAYTTAMRYLQQNPDADKAVRLANLLVNKGQEERGFELADEHVPNFKNHPKYRMTYAQLLVAADYPEKAYSHLASHHQKETLPDDMLESFTALSLQFNADDALLDVAANRDLLYLSDETIFDMAEYGIDNNTPLRDQLHQRVEAEYPDTHRLLGNTLSLAKGETLEEDEILWLRSHLAQYPAKRFMIARISHKAGLTDMTQMLLADINEDFESSDELLQAVRLYLTLGKAERANQLLAHYANNYPQTNDEAIYVSRLLVSAALGQNNRILPWLKQARDTHMTTLYDVYYTANNFKQSHTTLPVARTIYRLKQDSDTSTMLVTALLNEKQFAEALPIIRSMHEQGRRVDEEYLTALIQVMKTDANIEHKQELRALLLNRIENLSDDPTAKRELVYILIDQGLKREAQELLFALAKDAPVRDSAVDELFYLWGKRIPPKGFIWARERLIAAPKKDTSRWLQYLFDAGMEKEIINMLDNEIVDITAPGVYGIYADALEKHHKLAKLEVILLDQVEKTNDPKRLKSLITKANAFGQYTVVKRGEEKMIALGFADAASYRTLGVHHYERAHYTQAKQYLENYSKLPKEKASLAYKPTYYLGEIYLRDGKDVNAKPYFEKALSLINSLGKKTTEAQVVETYSLFRLNRDKEAIHKLKSLLKKKPGDKNMRADFAHLLLDSGYQDEAAEILAY